ncbi:MAG: hypothetical protein QM770_12580 [Tepidisphaeraceae bacterium]
MTAFFSARKTTAGRIIAMHAIVFALLLAVVAATATFAYRRAEANSIEKSGQRQLLIARQTARGIESYLQSIVETVQLGQKMVVDFERWDPDSDPATLPAQPPPRGPRPQGRSRLPDVGRRMMVERFIDRTWQQLGRRASNLIVADLTTGHVAVERAAEGAPTADEIIAAAREWLVGHGRDNANGIVISPRFDVGSFGFIVICMRPTHEDTRAMLAVVPMSMLSSMLVQERTGDAGIGSVLLDAEGTVMHSADRSLIGKSFASDVADPVMKNLAEHFRSVKAEAFDVTDAPMKTPDGRTVGRAVIAVAPVYLPDPGATCA